MIPGSVQITDLPLVTDPYVGKQADFHASLADTRLIAAANQSGKSHAGAREAAFCLLGLHPFREVEVPNVGWLVALDKEVGEKELFPKIERFLGPLVKKVGGGQHPYIETVNGSVCRLKSYDSGWRKFQAAVINWAWFDEEPPEDIYEETQTRLIRMRGFDWITYTPLSGRNWIWYKWIQQLQDIPKDELEVFNWSIHANTELDPKYIRKYLRKVSKALRPAREHGLYTDPHGVIWPEFDPRKHIVRPQPIQQHWTYYLVMDPGHTHPFAAILAGADEHGALHVIADYKKENRLIRDHAKSVADMVRDHAPFLVNMQAYKTLFQEHPRRIRHPSSIKLFYDRGHRVIQVIDPKAAQYRKELAAYGFHCKNANNEVNLGLERVGEYLMSEAADGKPMLRFYQGSTYATTTEIQTYSWKPGLTLKGEKAPEEPKKIRDDLCDAVRYFVMERPPLAQIPEQEPPRNSFAAIMKNNEKIERLKKLMGNDKVPEHVWNRYNARRGW